MVDDEGGLDHPGPPPAQVVMRVHDRETPKRARKGGDLPANRHGT
jgi:hypothetical protein